MNFYDEQRHWQPFSPSMKPLPNKPTQAQPLVLRKLAGVEQKLMYAVMGHPTTRAVGRALLSPSLTRVGTISLVRSLVQKNRPRAATLKTKKHSSSLDPAASGSEPYQYGF